MDIGGRKFYKHSDDWYDDLYLHKSVQSIDHEASD